jgi:hypothetical protein
MGEKEQGVGTKCIYARGLEDSADVIIEIVSKSDINTKTKELIIRKIKVYRNKIRAKKIKNICNALDFALEI